MFEEKINKHPKYGTICKNRHSNGFYRSRKRQHKLEKKFKSMSNQIWVTGVFYDEEKGRLVWFSNLWHRKYWRGIANRRVRRQKEFLQNGGYKKFFYMVLNCDIVHLISHDINMKERKTMTIKIIDNKKIYDYVRKSVLSGEIEKIADNFKDTEEIYNAVKGITDLMTVGYPQNKVDVDFKDFRKFFAEVEEGKIIVGESEKSAAEAVDNILKKIPATKNLLVNIKGDENKLDMLDINDATEKIAEKFPDAGITWGVTADNQLANKICVVMVMKVI